MAGIIDGCREAGERWLGSFGPAVREADRPSRMVSEQLVPRGISDGRVLQAMREVPRHLFVPEPGRDWAYSDRALPIEEGQTISQPYIVALMTELLGAAPGSRVLEVGTGSGYQAAVLDRVGATVFSSEIVPALARESAARLARLGFHNVRVRHADGALGWPEEAPFDGIIVTCAAPAVPAALVDQLEPGGRMVIPVGRSRDRQELAVVTRQADGKGKVESIMGVVFVPMTGPGSSAGLLEPGSGALPWR